MQRIIVLSFLLLISVQVKAQNVVDQKGTKREVDTTADSWKNDPANTQVKLAYKSDGATARPDSTAFVVKDNGRVGIGVTNPSWLLDVQGIAAIGRFKRIITGTPDQAPAFLFSRSRGSSGAELDIANGDHLGKFQFRGHISGSDQDYAYMIYKADSTVAGQGHFAFTKANASDEVMTITTGSYRVGLSTSTPQKTLHVNGSLQITNELNVGGNGTTAGSAGTSGQVLVSEGTGAAPAWTNVTSVADATNDTWVNDSTNTMVKVGTNSNGSTARTAGTDVVVKDNGSVGIGTASPTARLDIVPADATATGLRIRNISNSDAKQNTGINYANGGANMFIDANGNVYKKYNPLMSNAGATTFDGTYNTTATALDVVAINDGSIIRFSIYTNFVLGVSGTGANLYAEITYSNGAGFQLVTYGADAGSTNTNPLTISGSGTKTMTFDFQNGTDLILNSTATTTTGNIQVYHNGTGTIPVFISDSFRSR